MIILCLGYLVDEFIHLAECMKLMAIYQIKVLQLSSHLSPLSGVAENDLQQCSAV